MDLEPVSSHSPSAHLIRSKSHYRPTDPIAAAHDCLLSDCAALHIRIWNWAAGFFFFLPLLAISGKTDSVRLVFLFLATAGKCIRGPAAGAEGASVGEVGGNQGRVVTDCM